MQRSMPIHMGYCELLLRTSSTPCYKEVTHELGSFMDDSSSGLFITWRRVNDE